MSIYRGLITGAAVDVRTADTTELVALTGCPQTAAFHAEGDVATHTQLVLEHVTANSPPFAEPHVDTVLRLAAVLHDVGKPATTKAVGDGRYASGGHDMQGAKIVAELFGSDPALRGLPLGVFAAVHTAVRDHMWTYAADDVSPGAALRMTHLIHPGILTALWEADASGRICDDADEVAYRVRYAKLMLSELRADQPDSYGLVGQTCDVESLDPRVRRQLFRALITGRLRDQGAISAAAAAADRATPGGELTYTIGLPGVGKSTWARTVWQPRTGGVVLSAEGARRRDRRQAAAQVVAELPKLLAARIPVCVDATHMSRSSRELLLATAGGYNSAVHAVYFNAATELSLRRQNGRPVGAGVPAEAIEHMRRELRWPTPDEYQTLRVVEETGRSWEYTPTSRMLTPGTGSSRAHPGADCLPGV